MEKLPCEAAVWDTLPAIRAAIAIEIVNSGMSQNKAAALLGLAPSAVSQYISGKRGYRIFLSEEVKLAVAKAAEDIKSGKNKDLSEQICEICLLLRNSEGPCQICNEK